MKSLFQGIAGLVSSKKGALSLLVLTSMSVLAAFGKLDGMAYAAGCSAIVSIFCWTHAKTDVAAMQSGRGQQ